MAASCSSRLNYTSPMIVILGATGTGKSKLAVEISKRFNGEVINADAMQVYKGLDIATNKMTVAEQNGVPHHLLGFYDPKTILTVFHYRNYALNAIKEIIDRKKVPVVVGGTHYYIESILYDTLISMDLEPRKDSWEDSNEDGELPRKKIKVEETEVELCKLDNEKLFERLRKVDPDMAEVLHPNDRRRVMRSLIVHAQCGETLSSLLKKQRSQQGGSNSGGPLRFTNSICFLLQCDKQILIERLNARVDSMVAQGLVDELVEFFERYNEKNLEKNKPAENYTKGIFQSIGLKEFHEYLIQEEEKRNSEEGKKLLDAGVHLLKIATRQYARRQCKWIENRFLKNSERQMPPIYALDSTDLSTWKENVYDKAEQIFECHLSGKKPSIEPLPVNNTKVKIDRTYKCELCEKILMGNFQWEIHLKSQSHSKMIKRKERLKKLEEEKCRQTAAT